MKTGYMITRYMTKKKDNGTSHIITPKNFVMRAGKEPGVFMNEADGCNAFEEITNKVLDMNNKFEEDMSERTSHMRVFHDKENGFDYVYVLETVFLQE